jgi:hypothetical protein
MTAVSRPISKNSVPWQYSLSRPDPRFSGSPESCGSCHGMFAAPDVVRVGKEGSRWIGIVGTRTAESGASKTKDGVIMKKIFTSLSRLALLLGACAVTLPASPAYSQGKAKAKQKVKAEGKHGREAGELPMVCSGTQRRKVSFRQDCRKGRIKTVSLPTVLRKEVRN